MPALLHAREALVLLREVGNPVMTAEALNLVGWYSAQLGRYEEARRHCEAALSGYERHQDRAGSAYTCDSLGYIALHTERYADAVSYYGRAIALFRVLGHTYLEPAALDSLGDAHAALGEPRQAQQAWEQALTMYEEQHRGPEASATRHRILGLAQPTGADRR